MPLQVGFLMESTFANCTDEHFVDAAFVYFVSAQVGFVFVPIAASFARVSWQNELETCGDKTHNIYVS